MILDKDHFLTSAQCIGDGGDLSVRVGSDFKCKGGIIRKVAKIEVHPRFVFNKHGLPVYDIAVVRVNESFAFGETVQPVKLFQSGDEMKPGTNGIVTGYEDVGSDRLLSVTMPVIGKNMCDRAYKDWGGLDETQFCAGLHGTGGQDICDGGGLGSPMAIGNKVAGIVSWGYGCNEANYPRVFTKISVLYDWIEEQLGKIDSI